MGNMDRKEIQEQRKKGYFIESAMKLIRKGGVKNLTVKKVAELAGFASGTLYNYFKDLNELYSYCADEFWKECKEYVLEQVDSEDGIKGKIITSSISYSEYFINNPNVFDLIFLKDFGEISAEPPEVVVLLIESLYEGVAEGLIPEEKVKMVENLLSSSLHGLLLFYIKKRTKAGKDEILKLIEDETEYILELC